MAPPDQAQLCFCFERSHLLDHLHLCRTSLCAAINAAGESVGKRDFAAVRSLTQEARVIRDHIRFVRQEYCRHRQQHGC